MKNYWTAVLNIANVLSKRIVDYGNIWDRC